MRTKVILFALTFLALPGSAQADLTFGPQGSGAGQTSSPRDLAVEEATGNVYVVQSDRISVFDEDGDFLRAFGWGVDTGTPELETCTAASGCQAGLTGPGAGQLGKSFGIAIDNDPGSPSYRDVYVVASNRVQRFSFDDNGTPADPVDDLAVFERAWGSGVVTGGASGKGDITSGSATITNVQTTFKQFALSQTIVGAGIPAGTRIVGLGAGTIALSKAATASGTGVALSVAAGVGNVPVNEVQTLSVGPTNTFELRFSTPEPSPSKAATDVLLPATTPPSGPGSVQEALESFPNIDPGDVTVTGSPGDYTFTFGGRFADTDVDSIWGTGTGPSGALTHTTVQNGGSSAEVCPAVNAVGCTAGPDGFGPGQLSTNADIAIGQAGTVFVADFRENGVNKSPDRRVQTFNATGALTGQPLAESGRFNSLAADSSGNFYLSGGDGSGIKKYDSLGACLNCASPFNPSLSIRGLAIDYSTGEIFVADNGNLFEGVVNHYDSAGTQSSVIYGDELRRMTALAARHTVNGDFYAIHDAGASTKIVHVPIPPPGPIVVPGATANFAEPIGNVKATLNTKVNPEGVATTYHFEYIDDAAYKSGGFSSPAVQSTPELTVGSDFGLYSLSGEIGCQDPPQASCLVPETTYHFRAVAADGTNTDIGPEATFATREPFEFGETWSTDVGTASATLYAELNPLGIPASGYFEYVDDATYQVDKASGDGFQSATEAPNVSGGEPPLDFGDADDQLVGRSIQLSGLDPDTTYRYRFVATNAFVSKAGSETTLHTFATLDPPNASCPNQQFRASTAAANLPDCRAYEMVSPVEKGGGDIVGPKSFSLEGIIPGYDYARIQQATPGGGAITYSSYRPFGDSAAAPWASQYLANRDPSSGWQTAAISPPRSTLSNYFPDGLVDQQFQAFSSDLCTAFLVQDSDVALAPGDQLGFPDLYRRRNCDPAGYDLLTTAAPLNQDAGIRDKYFPRVQGFSTDGSRAVFRANAKLPTNGIPASNATGGWLGAIFQVYLQGAGAPRLVSVMPNGSAASLDSSVGQYRNLVQNYRPDTLARAVSEDGTRVFWSTIANDGIKSKLYLRLNADRSQSPISEGHCTDMAKGCTLAVSESVSTDPAMFWTATPDGSEALFSFTDGAHAGELYSYDVASETATQIVSGFKGMLGASEDLTSVYLVSTQALDAGATAGQSTLYLFEGNEGFTFISPYPAVGGTFALERPLKRPTRVSPDGVHAAFATNASLTGQDNADAVNGLPDIQVYLYDAIAGGAGELHCVSCNPTGARPAGRQITPAIESNPAKWAASLIPGWEYSLHAPRVLSDDGSRLFFESFDTLLPTDTNGMRDVYQWQASGSGECDSQDANYFESNGGCLSLISTGQSPNDAFFADASVDGSDIFLLTDERLFGGDRDSLVDLYDARAGGGFAAPPALLPGCEGEACRGDGSATPNVSGAGTGAFEGAGDPAPVFKATKPHCPKGKRKVRSKGRVRCVKPRDRKRRAKHDRRLGR